MVKGMIFVAIALWDGVIALIEPTVADDTTADFLEHPSRNRLFPNLSCLDT
jgi:hypothetical protein